MSVRLPMLLAAVTGVLVALPVAAAQLRVEAVADNVWAIVGPTTNRTPENLGNNATFGLVVTSEGAVLIDSGGSYRGARQLHDAVQSVSNAPIRYVINTGGQDHRWLGNDYFAQLGATIIASAAATRDQAARLNAQWGRLESLIGADRLAGTRERYADITFATEHQLVLGGVTLQMVHSGGAHTPGDVFVWLPTQKVMFAGDIVYVERMLSVGSQSHSGRWIKAFERMASYQPTHVVPGHGGPVSLARATADTYDYLVFLRGAVADFAAQGGDISEISRIDQSRFSYLSNYETLRGRNAQQVYTELEWE